MKLLSLARDLRRRKARERQQLFVCEGVRAVEELLRSPIRTRGALVGPALAASDRGLAVAAELRSRGIEVLHLDERDFASAADTDSPQGILAIAEVPQVTLATLDIGSTARIVVLDSVQDPGNVGTILRTAAALGADATVALPGTVDLWNAKVVRSAMGAHFHHRACVATWDEFDGFRARHGVALWAADAGGESVEAGEPPARIALVVGNEGNGLDPRALEHADRLVALPISSTVESLNVAVATGILLYVLRPR